MSQNTNPNTPSVPKTESWVRVMFLAFLPVVAALFAPEAARIPLLAAALALSSGRNPDRPRGLSKITLTR